MRWGSKLACEWEVVSDDCVDFYGISAGVLSYYDCLSLRGLLTLPTSSPFQLSAELRTDFHAGDWL